MSGSSARGDGYRTLADQLRSWPDERLTRLLADRPDLATPTPHDFAQLASRAATRASLLRALDQLTRLELFVLDALVVSGLATPDSLAATVRASPAAVEPALERLLDLALAWESPQGLRALSGVADGLTGSALTGVSGLRPVSADPYDLTEVESRLAELSEPARAMLTHVADHGGEATTGTARHTVLPADARTPAEELLARKLLVPRGGGTVVLPGEVGIALRGGRTTLEPVDDEPEVATSAREQSSIDRAAAGAAFEAVRRVELLLDHWGTQPPSSLRSGGLAVRDLKATALHLHVEESVAALIIEVASAAGLLATAADSTGQPAWIPTDAFDVWTAGSVEVRWIALIRAWLESPRMPGLVGSKDSAGKTWNALSPELASAGQTESRRMALTALAELPAGQVLATGTGLPSLAARISWLRPRRPRTRAEQVAWAVTEAAALGVTGLGAMASFSRSLLADDEATARDTLASLLPRAVDHLLIQADLTAVAPGPLESTLARTLLLLADVESRGGATVYRFSPGSVRRALDSGWSTLEIHDFLAEVSRTPVPQPLTYLVDDTARTFGTIRVGHAEAFLRADDEASLTELLHHPKAASLGLRRIAPTVLISTTPVDVLLPRLRDLGAAPVVEAADGTVRIARPDRLRARSPRERRAPALKSARASALNAQVLTAIRAGDRVSESRPTVPTAALSPQGSLVALREAVEAGEPVLIGYVDNHGSTSERIVDPLRVEGGWLTAHDHRSDDTRTFAVHRITAVKPVGPAGEIT